jgi:hypothetical protein
MDLKGIIMRRRGKPPKTHFVTSPAPLVEEVQEQLKTVYGFTPLRSRMKRGKVPQIKYPASRRTYIGNGNIYGKETVEEDNTWNGNDNITQYKKNLSHKELLEGNEKEEIAYQYKMSRKYNSQWWSEGQVGGGAVFPLKVRFTTEGSAKILDKIYDTDTGPKASIAKLCEKSLYGYCIGKDTINRFPAKIRQTQASVGPGTYNSYTVSTKLGNNWSVPSNFFANKFEGKKMKKDKSLIAIQTRNRKRGLTPVGKRVVHKKYLWQPLNRGIKLSMASRETFADKLVKRRLADNERRELAIYKLKTGGDQAEFVPTTDLHRGRYK